MKFKINNIIPIHQLPNDHNNPLENQLRNVIDIIVSKLMKDYIHFTEKKPVRVLKYMLSSKMIFKIKKKINQNFTGSAVQSLC